MATQGKKLRFNVGGEIFETMTTTFSKANADSSLEAMRDDAHDQRGELFIDRDPACFRVLLNLLRTGELLHLPPAIPDALLYREAHRYKLLDKLRSAKHVRLDGDNLKLTTSITGRTLLNESASIRAGPHGDCAVANGNVFRIYDWMFQELPSMNLDYMKIVGMEWYDSENILISGQKEAGGGAIGLFNPQNPKPKHKFDLRDDPSSILTPGNLAIDLNKKIFYCCCRDASNQMPVGIGAWDIITGQKIGFLKAGSVGNALKLQWLRNRECLMAVIHNAGGNKISLWDPREKGTDLEHFPYTMISPKVVVDAVWIEEKKCVSVINKAGCFGFVDLRKRKDKKWNFIEHEKQWFPLSGNEGAVEPKPKLGWHGGKLFRSVNGVVSVYGDSGSEWRLASQFQPKHGGGPIHDFSIGSDKLFSLQAQPHDLYEINVWETPPPPPPVLI